MDFIDLDPITTPIAAFRAIDTWLERRRGRREHADDAVRSILHAVNQTQAYLVDRSAGAQSREIERDLVGLWTEAAIAIRRYDQQLAGRLQMKAEYWANPTRWKQTDVDRVGIRIDEIADRARTMLGGDM